VTNAASERQIKRSKEREARDFLTRKMITKMLMGTPDGRRWIWLQLGECGIYHTSFDPGPGGTARMNFSEGKRSLGLSLLADVTRFCPSDYITMQRENGMKEDLDERSDTDT
jgi:hypothetical protein